MAGFNPRARVGRDVEEYAGRFVIAGFNPRARVGRDVIFTKLSCSFFVFQSTRPRGARLFLISFLCLPDSVSIHAPAWGATLQDASASSFDEVSIHAPAWGATRHNAAPTSW